MLLRRLVPAILALGMLAGATSAAPSRSGITLGHIVFWEQAPPCGQGCKQQLTIVAGDASGEKRLTTRTVDSAPAWSPNGKLIAFVRTLSSGRAYLHVVRPDGGGDRKLLLLRGSSPPTWSPNGRSILVTASTGTRRSHSWAVLAVSLAPHPKVKVLFTLSRRAGEMWPEIRVSPDGKWLSLVKSWSNHAGEEGYWLYLVRPNGTGWREIASAFSDTYRIYLQGVSWSPDSSRLAYVGVPDAACGPTPPPTLWTVSAAGNDAHEVWADTCESGSWVAPDTVALGSTTTWSPDGTEILYSTNDYAGYQFHEANASTGTIQPFPVPAGDCGSGPGSCRLVDPQWTTH